MGQRRCETRIQTGFSSWIQQERWHLCEFQKKTIFDDLIQNKNPKIHMKIKIKMALLWILKFCSQAKYIALVDDDMYVNIPNTIGFIKRAEKDKYLYSGFLIDKPRPIYSGTQ